MAQSGTIIVQNLTNSFDVDYLVGAMVSGSPVYGLASGTLNNPSSGTKSNQVNVSGYELYAVQFNPVGSTAVSVNNLVVNEEQPSTVSLNLDVV